MIPRSCKFNVLIRSKFKGRLFSSIEVAHELGYSFPYARDLLAEMHHAGKIELIQPGEQHRYDIWRVVP